MYSNSLSNSIGISYSTGGVAGLIHYLFEYYSSIMSPISEETTSAWSDQSEYGTLRHVIFRLSFEHSSKTFPTCEPFPIFHAIRLRLVAAVGDYLAIPMSSLSVQRMSSKGRDLLGMRRNANTLNAEFPLPETSSFSINCTLYGLLT